MRFHAGMPAGSAAIDILSWSRRGYFTRNISRSSCIFKNSFLVRLAGTHPEKLPQIDSHRRRRERIENGRRIHISTGCTLLRGPSENRANQGGPSRTDRPRDLRQAAKGDPSLQKYVYFGNAC